MMATSDAVKAAVIEAYTAATGVTRTAALNSFAGGASAPFDSIVGLELIVALEARFGVEIDETEETERANFSDLAAFTRMVERYVDGSTAKGSR